MEKRLGKWEKPEPIYIDIATNTEFDFYDTLT